MAPPPSAGAASTPASAAITAGVLLVLLMLGALIPSVGRLAIAAAGGSVPRGAAEGRGESKHEQHIAHVDADPMPTHQH